jgi:ubiquinone/menaquinone biosynthesis C-methylase UbiE
MSRVQRSRSESAVFARELFGPLSGRYDLLAELLSFGQNHRWREAMVGAVLRLNGPAGQLLDVATGTAGVALALTGCGEPGSASQSGDGRGVSGWYWVRPSGCRLRMPRSTR